MKNLIFSIGVIIIIILMFSPFFTTENINNKLIVVTNLVSALASVFTFVIALLLYNKYGVEKSLINKNTEAVFNLLEELKNSYFVLLKGRPSLMLLRLDSLGDEFFTEQGNIPLFFDISYFYGLDKIREMSNNIYLPTEIVVKLKNVMPQSFSFVKEDRKDCWVVTIPEAFDAIEEREEKGEKGMFFGKLNARNINLKEFVDEWALVITEAKKWLQKHSSVDIDLNF